MIFICFDSLDRTLHVVTVLNKSARTSHRISPLTALKANELSHGPIISIPAALNVVEFIFQVEKSRVQTLCLTFDLINSSVLAPESQSTWRGGHSQATVLATTSLSVDDRYFRHRLSSQSRGDRSCTRPLSASFSTSRARLVVSQF